MLPSRLQKCMVPFTILVLEGSTETGLFKHLSNHFFQCPSFRKYIGYEGHLYFGKCSIFNAYFRDSEKSWEKEFCFWENSIWIGCVKLSLLRREYLSSTINVFTSCFKIFHCTKRDICQFKFYQSDQEIW